VSPECETKRKSEKDERDWCAARSGKGRALSAAVFIACLVIGIALPLLPDEVRLPDRTEFLVFAETVVCHSYVL
jgi:hypothetical protein